MAVLLALAIGLVWWVTAWSFGIQAFDAFLLTIALVVATAAVRMALPFVRQLLGRDVGEPSEPG